MTLSEIVNKKYQKSSDEHDGYFSHIYALCLPGNLYVCCYSDHTEGTYVT